MILLYCRMKHTAQEWFTNLNTDSAPQSLNEHMGVGCTQCAHFIAATTTHDFPWSGGFRLGAQVAADLLLFFSLL